MSRNVIRQEIQEFHEGGLVGFRRSSILRTSGHGAGYEQVLSPGNIPI